MLMPKERPAGEDASRYESLSVRDMPAVLKEDASDEHIMYALFFCIF